MMLEYLGYPAESEVIERAVIAAIDANETTTTSANARNAGAGGRFCSGWSCKLTACRSL